MKNLSLFSCIHWPHVYFLFEVSGQMFCLFLKLESLSSLLFWIRVVHLIYVYKYLLPILPFCFLNSFFQRANVLTLIKYNYLFFTYLLFIWHFKKALPALRSRTFCPIFSSRSFNSHIQVYNQDVVCLYNVLWLSDKKEQTTATQLFLQSLGWAKEARLKRLRDVSFHL